jgi:thioesterase domain-containing protein
VLGLVRVGPQDDLFELGGDSLLAIALIARLEKTLDREIPLKVINLAPAFGAFCVALEQRPATMYSPLVVIKPGSGPVSLFCVHGAGGSVMELFALGRRVTWPGEVIGIQARGLDRRESPHASVGAMANDYLVAIKARQPRGPYFLCGYSFGGLVALEIAQRLKGEGQEVAFVGLLDTLPPGNHLFRSWAWAGYLRRELTRESPQQSQYRNRAVVRARRVALYALWASIAYRPRPYAGELTLFEPTDRDMGLSSSVPRWSRYATAVRQVTLPGGHLDMVTQPNSDVSAKQLSACLASLTSLVLSTPLFREPSDSWAQPIASSHQP